MDLRKVVGKNVKKYREELGVSQEELAFRAGLHRTYISGVERGVRNPTITVLGKIAGALAVRPSEILCYEKNSAVTG